MSGSPHWQRKIQFTCAVPELHSSVSAVLDDNSLRSLGNSAGSVPSHAVAGQAVKGHAGELGLQRIADVGGVHVAVEAAGQNSLVDGVNNVISVSRELVRGVAVGFLISRDECLGLFILASAANGVSSIRPSAREVSKPSMERMPSMPSQPKKTGS